MDPDDGSSAAGSRSIATIATTYILIRNPSTGGSLMLPTRSITFLGPPSSSMTSQSIGSGPFDASQQSEGSSESSAFQVNPPTANGPSGVGTDVTVGPRQDGGELTPAHRVKAMLLRVLKSGAASFNGSELSAEDLVKDDSRISPIVGTPIEETLSRNLTVFSCVSRLAKTACFQFEPRTR